jgi:RNA polymerase sigma factor (TIGR02999 family)
LQLRLGGITPSDERGWFNSPESRSAPDDLGTCVATQVSLVSACILRYLYVARTALSRPVTAFFRGFISLRSAVRVRPLLFQKRHPPHVECSPRMSEVTRILSAVEQVDARASERLLPLVYEELRKLARQRMAQERGDHTLQATAIVHEAWLKLAHHKGGAQTSRAGFFSAAGEAMRQILVDHARTRRRVKRGGGAAKEAVDVDDLPAKLPATLNSSPEEILALDGAIRRLEAQDPLAAKVVTMRFFAALTVPEIAEALGISERTVKREWQFARAWLFRELAE